MMPSLYSAVSGLKNHQVKMDVIGNNIANVNTTGFKSSSVAFATQLSQTMKGASAPTAAQGGSNQIQVGLGSTIGSINQNMTQGSAETTGNATDMMLQGSGYFVLNNNGQQVFTRAGGFTNDGDGTLIDPATGAKVQGYSWSADDTTAPVWGATGDIKFNTGDVLATDSGIFPVTTNTIDVSTATPESAGPPVVPAYINVPIGSEDVTIAGMTAVPLTQTPTTGQFNYDPKTGNVAFATGFVPPAAGSVNMTYVTPAVPNAANTATTAIVDYPPLPGATVYVANGSPPSPYTLSTSDTPNDGEYTVKEVNGKYQITFGANDVGIPAYTDNLGNPIAAVPATTTSATSTISYDFANNPHTLSSFSIDQSGVITGVYSNGTPGSDITHKIAQIEVASFANDTGLQNVGGSFYTQSNNSGVASIGAAGTSGRANIVSGSLEMSNTDLSQEMTDMITAQRGFQANSRVITVTDTLLQELIDLKRS